MFTIPTIAFAISTLFLVIANFHLRYPTKRDLVNSLNRKTWTIRKMEALIKENAKLKEANEKNRKFAEKLIAENQKQALTIQELKNRIFF